MNGNIIQLKKAKNMKSMEQKEQLNTLENAEEQDKRNYSEELINRTQILTTPFQAITLKTENGEVKKFIAWGRHRLTDFLSDEEMNTKVMRLEEGYADWELIGSMAGLINQTLNNEI